jgi:hypothetical protein
MTPTRQALSFALVLVGLAAAGACGGGSPASPADTGAAGDTSDDAATDASSDDAAAAGDAAFASCGTSPATGTIPADVLAVMSVRCQTCHQMPPLNNAPFPLLTYADVHSAFGTIPKYQEMHMVIQANGSPHMPYGKAPQLDATQFKTLDDWLLDCAPPGE